MCFDFFLKKILSKWRSQRLFSKWKRISQTILHENFEKHPNLPALPGNVIYALKALRLARIEPEYEIYNTNAEPYIPKRHSPNRNQKDEELRTPKTSPTTLRTNLYHSPEKIPSSNQIKPDVSLNVSPTTIPLLNRTNVYHQSQDVQSAVPKPSTSFRRRNRENSPKTSPVVTPEKSVGSPNRTPKITPESSPLTEKALKNSSSIVAIDKRSPNNPTEKRPPRSSEKLKSSLENVSPNEKRLWDLAPRRHRTSPDNLSPTVSLDNSPLQITSNTLQKLPQAYTPYRHSPQFTGIEKNHHYKVDPIIFKKSLKQKETESDSHRLAQRQKQIDFGYNSPGYQRYIVLVPKESRNSKDPHQPVTPRKNQKCSKRSWDGQVRKWRRELHFWDPPDYAAQSEDEDIGEENSQEEEKENVKGSN